MLIRAVFSDGKEEWIEKDELDYLPGDSGRPMIIETSKCIYPLSQLDHIREWIKLNEDDFIESKWLYILPDLYQHFQQHKYKWYEYYNFYPTLSTEEHKCYFCFDSQTLYNKKFKIFGCQVCIMKLINDKWDDKMKDFILSYLFGSFGYWHEQYQTLNYKSPEIKVWLKGFITCAICTKDLICNYDDSIYFDYNYNSNKYIAICESCYNKEGLKYALNSKYIISNFWKDFYQFQTEEFFEYQDECDIERHNNKIKEIIDEFNRIYK